MGWIGADAGRMGCRLLSTVHAACFDPHWSENEFARLIAAPGTVAAVASLPAKSKGGSRPAGLVMLRTAGDGAEILTFGVVPDCRLMGIGKELMEVCRTAAKKAGADELFLEVAAGNAAALALYAAGGFQEVGRCNNYYEPQDDRTTSKDALIMRLALD